MHKTPPTALDMLSGKNAPGGKKKKKVKVVNMGKKAKIKKPAPKPAPATPDPQLLASLGLGGIQGQ